MKLPINQSTNHQSPINQSLITNKGYFVISLDFELLWGVFDKVDYENKEIYFKNTRIAIPGILELFEKYQIHCTWATVGMLFNEDWTSWENNIPELVPNYEHETLSAYQFGNKIKTSGTEIFCFAKGIIKQIQNTPNQEIGTHTYSHYYCLEEGQTLNTFKTDLKKSIELANRMGIELKSLVFPRNQFNEDYLKVCYELGIENVRSNPDNWYWKETQNDSLKNKIFRTGDAYMGLNDKSYTLSKLKLETGKPLAQKASRLLRPYTENKFLNDLKLKRIKLEMTEAARNNKIYHLWWHPHNFGNHPEENLKDLKTLLNHFQSCQEKFGFQSIHMQGLNDLKKKGI